MQPINTNVSRFRIIFVMLCAIWHHLYNLKNVKNTHGGVILLVKLQAEAYNFTKSNTFPYVFFTFLKLNEWYQIAQSMPYLDLSHIFYFIYFSIYL